MAFLRRILGGPKRADPDPVASPGDEAQSVVDEAERDRQLLRAEALRLDSNLIQRQLRYASRSWTPPAQGGQARCEDGDGSPGAGGDARA
jgi:hypothetical protein